MTSGDRCGQGEGHRRDPCDPSLVSALCVSELRPGTNLCKSKNLTTCFNNCLLEPALKPFHRECLLRRNPQSVQLRLKASSNFRAATVKRRIRAAPDEHFAEQPGTRQTSLGKMLYEPVGSITIRHRGVAGNSNEVCNQIPQWNPRKGFRFFAQPNLVEGQDSSRAHEKGGITQQGDRLWLVDQKISTDHEVERFASRKLFDRGLYKIDLGQAGGLDPIFGRSENCDCDRCRPLSLPDLPVQRQAWRHHRHHSPDPGSASRHRFPRCAGDVQ
jgi:hypothetical protein